MYIPPILVREDVDENAKLLIFYLYHRNPQQRQRIIDQYPELAEIAARNEEQARLAITDFTRVYFQTHHDTIGPAIVSIKKNLQEDGPHALEMLGSIMEYQWPETHKGFTFIPSLLPFSPWDNETNTVYLSLLSFIKGNAGHVENGKTLSLNATQLLVHEVSHFILWKIVSRLGLKFSEEYGDAVKHLAQEIIAPVVMNQSEIKESLGLHDYWGNPYLKPIVIRMNAEDMNIVDFFSKEYAQLRAEGRTFEQYVLRVFEILTALQSEMKERMDMWNENGARIFDRDLFAVYTKPIEYSQNPTIL